MTTSSVLSKVSLTSELSSTSLHKPLQSSCIWLRKFLVKELQPYLTLIAAHIDFSAVALHWFSHEVIEVHQTQELLNFSGDEREKCLKVLKVYEQLRKDEDRVPYFLHGLMKSGESSVTNQTLYDKLADEMDFTDVDVRNACSKNNSNLSVKLKQRRSGGGYTPCVDNIASPSNHTQRLRSQSSSSGIESSTENLQKYLSYDPRRLHTNVPAQEPASEHKPTLQQENAQLKEENFQLQEKIEQLCEMLTATQKNLVSIQNKYMLAITKSEQHLQQYASGQHRRRSQMHPSVIAEEQTRVRKISRSLDSINDDGAI